MTMKRLIYTLAIMITAISCGKFDEYNTNPDSTTEASAALLATGVELGTFEHSGDAVAYISNNALPKYVAYLNESGTATQYNEIGRCSFGSYIWWPTLEQMVKYASGTIYEPSYRGLAGFIKAWNAWYLTLTGRNDWPSQLAGPRSRVKSYFYPSAGVSVVLSEIIPGMPRQLEFVKLRASFADVGTPFERWLANPVHEWPDKGNAWATDTTYPVELKPERTQSWEVGLQARFLTWFSLDATYYRTNTKNQTFFPEISTGSGYSEIPIQSGNVLNEGFELALGFEKQWGIFNWASNYTFSTNRNEILSLAENAVNPVTGEKLNISTLNMGVLGNAVFLLREGGTLGDLYSRQDFVRDSNGDIYVDASGNVSTSTINNVDDYIKLGSTLPKANMAWRNDFRLGNFNFGFMFTARLGGVVFSRTQAMLDYYGVSEASAAARDNGGYVVNGSDIVDANRWYTAAAGGSAVPQYYTYQASNVRLQEASIGYTFPRKMLGDVCELTLQLVGRNLWMIYNKAPFDPESIATTGNYYQGIDYFMMPATRNFGFNVRIKF